jgi:hypothetical protein
LKKSGTFIALIALFKMLPALAYTAYKKHKANKAAKDSNVTQPTRSFQVLSEIHIEADLRYANYEIPPSAPHLVLAGGIGRLLDYDTYRHFLERQAGHYEKIFLVLGASEFYGLTYDEGRARARRLMTAPLLQNKLFLLDRNRYDFPGSDMTLLGCTLWSNIPPFREQLCLANADEFKYIFDWSIESHNSAHAADTEWLRQQVSRINDKAQQQPPRKIMVVTHHVPSASKSLGPENVAVDSSAYATELISRADWPNVGIWAFGHTQYATEQSEGKLRVLSNQRVDL